MATIKVRENGPLRVEGDDVAVIDWNGNEYPIEKRPFVLCSCGHSKQRQLCDGTNKTIDFHAHEAAPKPQ